MCSHTLWACCDVCQKLCDMRCVKLKHTSDLRCETRLLISGTENRLVSIFPQVRNITPHITHEGIFLVVVYHFYDRFEFPGSVIKCKCAAFMYVMYCVVNCIISVNVCRVRFFDWKWHEEDAFMFCVNICIRCFYNFVTSWRK